MSVGRLVLFLPPASAISGCATNTAAAPTNAPKSYSATVLADAPVAYWRMAEMAGTAMADATNNKNDGHYDGIVMLAQPGPHAGDGSTAAAPACAPAAARLRSPS